MARDIADVIVIGLGGMGAATAHELARRGLRVLGLEQFTPGHDRGSSHGGTRIIRKAYFEHPDYVPLVQRAYDRWYTLEQQAGRRLLTECPVLTVGPPESELVTGVRQSAKIHNLPTEDLDHDEIRKRYPTFRLKENEEGVLELTAGFVEVDESVRLNLELAASLGAELHFEEAVRSWSADVNGVQVATNKGTYAAKGLVITAGPWAEQLLGPVADGLSLMRQVVFWMKPRNPERFRRDVFPIFLLDTPRGFFYGLPMLDSAGVKIARHYGAEEVRHESLIRRTLAADEDREVREFVREYLPDAEGDVGRTSVCTYTLTPDRHFLIDVHPDHDCVCFAAGFSGHGYKFAPVVAEALADLVETGRSGLPISPFALRQFSREK